MARSENTVHDELKLISCAFRSEQGQIQAALVLLKLCQMFGASAHLQARYWGRHSRQTIPPTTLPIRPLSCPATPMLLRSGCSSPMHCCRLSHPLSLSLLEAPATSIKPRAPSSRAVQSSTRPSSADTASWLSSPALPSSSPRYSCCRLADCTSMMLYMCMFQKQALNHLQMRCDSATVRCEWSFFCQHQCADREGERRPVQKD